MCGVGGVCVLRQMWCECICSMCSVRVVCIIVCCDVWSLVRGAWNSMSGSWCIKRGALGVVYC